MSVTVGDVYKAASIARQLDATLHRERTNMPLPLLTLQQDVAHLRDILQGIQFAILAETETLSIGLKGIIQTPEGQKADDE